MRQEEDLSTTDPEPRSPGTRGGSPDHDAKKPLRLRRRVRVLLRRMGIWLDAWGLRGYPHDTHDWPSKVERLRSMKTTSRHVR